jgi:hypothetical protein
MLSPAAWARARRFMVAGARPLDRALFAFRFEAGPAGAVVRELAAYRNEDGGFGHGLEPDVRTPLSSALATGIALDVLHEVGAPADHALVRGAIGYLRETYDADAGVWRVVPPGTNDHPHAPWWHDEYGSLADTFDDFLVIPRAQLVGLLHGYAALAPGLFPGDWLAAVTERTVADIEALDAAAFGGGGDTLRYALDLAETEALPPSFRDRLLPKLRGVALTVVSRDPAAWDSYCAPPLKIAPSPDCAVAGLFRDDLQAHLDYQIAHQTPEGAWEPTWTWGDFYPDVWSQARQEWRGHLTLETLTALHSFGRIEAIDTETGSHI